MPEPPSATSLARRMVEGALWMVGLRVALRAIGLVSTLILARLLTPEDFGLVALATTIAALLEICGQFSFDLALIRDPNAGRSHYDTVWTLNILRGVVIGLGLVALAGPLAALFEEPRLEAVVHWLALASFLQGFWNVATVEFRKRLEMGKDFHFFLIPKLASFVLGVAAAFAWQDYWALVLAVVSRRVIQLALGYVMRPYRPRLSLAHWRELVGFSKWLLVNNVLTFVRDQIDVLVVGKFAGPGPLGLYSVATEIANLPTTELALPIGRVIFPGYAQLAADRARLAEGFVQVTAMVLLLAVPAGLGIGLTARPLVWLFLGPNWLDAVPLIQVLVIFGVLRVGYANVGPAFLALGHTRIEPTLTAIYLTMLAPLLLLTVPAWGPLGAAWSLVAAAAVGLVLHHVAALRLLGLGPARLAGAVWRTLAASLAMVAAVYLLLPEPDDGLAAMALGLALRVAVGALTFVACLLGLWWLSGRPAGAESRVLAAWSERGRFGRNGLRSPT